MMTDDNTGYQPDVRLLCEKFEIGRHQLVLAMTELCRLTKQSPKEMLVTLEGIDDIFEYATQVKFSSIQEESYFDEQYENFE